MRRADFEHVIAAAANVIGEDEFVVIGSQALLGSVPNPPAGLQRSMEADVYPLFAPEKADDLEGALGDGSAFSETHGYFAHGVGPTTAKAPAGWESRLVRVEIPPRLNSARKPIAWCLEPHDLVLAKLARGSMRDWEYAIEAVRSEIVGISTLVERAGSLPLEDDAIERIVVRLRSLG